jgi:hypothetical protein
MNLSYKRWPLTAMTALLIFLASGSVEALAQIAPARLGDEATSRGQGQEAQQTRPRPVIQLQGNPSAWRFATPLGKMC